MEIHAHRGGRGLMPENTIEAFLNAVEIGANAIELDVIIAADNQVLVSHEPWLSHLNCLSPSGNRIAEFEEKSYNLFKMQMDEILMADCGSVPQLAFPLQKTFMAFKPKLSEVFEAVENHSMSQHKSNVIYNIEIKSDPAHYGLFQPFPEEFVSVLCALLDDLDFKERLVLQSFDMQILKALKKRNPIYHLGLLVEGKADIENDLISLGFFPEYYNPEFKLLNRELIEFAHQRKIKIIPWTINELEDMEEIAQMGADGMITDYPDIAMHILK